jgi:hypothetical protein
VGDEPIANGGGHTYIATVGIDRYRDKAWKDLHNAANDARGAWKAFTELGCLPFCEPLLDEAATRSELELLVHDRLQSLAPEDGLILFFAGHGFTTKRPGNAGQEKVGYLAPHDASPPAGRATSSWLHLPSWLSRIAQLPPRHILVILDACHSGIALLPLMHWAGNVQLAAPLSTLLKRRSRRVIASALDDETALDSGQSSQHSLFTECLLDGLTGGIARRSKQRHITGLDIWSYIRTTFQDFPEGGQTPNQGAFETHDQGDFKLSVPAMVRTTAPTRFQRAMRRWRQQWRRNKGLTALQARQTRDAATSRSPRPTITTRPIPRKPLPRINTARPPATYERFTARLDHQHAERQLGGSVLTFITAEFAAVRSGWTSWAAAQGHMTLVSEHQEIGDLVRDLLAQIPWVRCLPTAHFVLDQQASLYGANPGIHARKA